MMNNTVYLKYGRLLYGIAVLATGIIHIVTRNFPQGLLPVPVSLPGRLVLVYIAGIALIIAGLLILVKKYTRWGAIAAGIVWLLLFFALQMPRLLSNLHDPTRWTPAFEVVALLGGTFLLSYDLPANYLPVNQGQNYKLAITGRYIFLSALMVFTVQHYLYLPFIATLIPTWMPLPVFWAYVVLAAFFLVSVSLLINKMVRLSALLLALMFLLWFFMLHLPRVVMNNHTETEWTSLFIVLAMGGISLMIAGGTPEL